MLQNIKGVTPSSGITKHCRKCNKDKPRKDFRRTNNYYYAYCDPCRIKATREYNKKRSEIKRKHKLW